MIARCPVLLAATLSMDSDHERLVPYARESPKMPLPDPSHFPDPYPFRNHLSSSVPALSSTASSSASTRSSAYTSSGSALAYVDYSNVHVASGDDDHPGAGITPDALVQMLANDPAHSSSARAAPLRTQDPSRWSESYSGSVRSRSSSIGNGVAAHDFSPPLPPLNQKPSYDVSWQTVDEKDEITMTDDETDDEPVLDAIDDDQDDGQEEERTSAAVVAEEGRGLIVQGDNVPIVQLQVQPGAPRPSIINFFPFNSSRHVLIIRHDTFIDRIINNPQCRAVIFDFCPPANRTLPPSPRHLCQLSGCFTPRSCCM